MNDIPGIDQLPERWRGTALLLLIVSPYLTRAYHSLANGGGLRGLWSAIWFGTNQPSAPSSGSGTPIRINILAAALLSLSLGAGLIAGCGTLDPAGVYQGDRTLYDADLVIVSSYDTLHGFVSWEYENRDALAKWPELRKAADFIRAGARDWITSAIALREAYKLQPGPETRTALERGLDLLRQSTLQATKYLTTYGTP